MPIFENSFKSVSDCLGVFMANGLEGLPPSDQLCYINAVS